MKNTATSPKLRYRNPWHRPDELNSGPPYYETDAKPLEYRGHLVYERLSGLGVDVVKDGVCVTQRAKGGEGIKREIDKIILTGWPRGFPES